LSLLPSKHLGVFPEQVSGWNWLSEKIKKELKNRKEIKVLNLFAYTGGATMAALKAGAEVVHLDASKFAVDLAIGIEGRHEYDR
jgi:23S rRNA (cytosine1962-C5)-methyltransferase